MEITKESFANKTNFKNSWIKYMKAHSSITDDDKLNEIFDKNYKEGVVSLYNSAKGTTKEIKSLQLLHDIFDKYIIVENGVLFLNHNEFTSPLGNSLKINKKYRKYNKGLMKKAQINSDVIGEAFYNLMQSKNKLALNTLYGTMLNIYSKYYNFDVAAATTIRGRSTVSMNGLTIESAFGVYRPYNIEAHLFNIAKLKEKDISKYSKYLRVPSNKEIIDHLLLEYRDDYYAIEVLEEVVSNLNDEDKKKVFYANNFTEVLKIPHSIELLTKFFEIQNNNWDEVMKLHDDPEKAIKFKNVLYLDSANPPESVREFIEEFMDMIDVLLTGFYWYEGDIDSHGNDFPSTQDIFKSIQRQKIMVTDTDSLILLLVNSMTKIVSAIPDFDKITNNMTDFFRSFILGSIIIGAVDKIIKKGLARYTKQSLIPKEFRDVISYKQEYVFRTLQVTKGAKNYLGIIAIQEGILLPKEKDDIKGLSLKKSNFNKKLSSVAKNISIDMIAKNEKIDIRDILHQIDKSREEIRALYKSAKNIELFTVAKLKVHFGGITEGDYRIKACRLYEALYDIPINIPGSFLITNLKLDEEDIKERFPDKYERLLKEAHRRLIFYNTNSLRNKWEALYPEKPIDIEYNELIENVEKAKDIDEIKYIIKEAKKKGIVPEIIDKFTAKKSTIDMIDKIAIPLDSESVDDFITEYIDSDDLTKFENLTAVIIQGIGLTVVRNNKKHQILTNTVSYY